ncbi:MAG: HlyD family secretion protein [Nitritalea sp.]
MRKSSLFPPEIIKGTVEVYDARIGVTQKSIYLLLVSLVLCAILALPLVQVAVSVDAAGALQSAVRANVVQLPLSGRVQEVFLRQNRQVKAGDLLLSLDVEAVNSELAELRQSLAYQEGVQSDLAYLLGTAVEKKEERPFRSKRVENQWKAYQAQLVQRQSPIRKAERDFERAQNLFAAKVLPFTEFDEVQVHYQQERLLFQAFQEQKLAEFALAMEQVELEISRLKQQEARLLANVSMHHVYAGVSGNLLQVADIRPGDMLLAGEKIAQISPQETLRAHVLVPAQDIAFLQEGQEVWFQVDAFHHHIWGLLKGKVLDIGADREFFGEQQAGYWVVCALDAEALTRKDGTVGALKKGMQVQARFQVGKRSLWHLLYQRLDRWFSPHQVSTN